MAQSRQDAPTSTFFRIPVPDLAGEAPPGEAVRLETLSEAFQDPDAGVLLITPRLLRWIVRFDRSAAHARLGVAFYTLPKGRLAASLQKYDRRAAEQIDWEALPDKHVTLLAFPSSRERARHSLPHWAIHFWGLRFAGEIMQQCRRYAPSFGPLQRRTAIGLLGHARFEEIRDVLASEGWPIDPADDTEVLHAFAASYLSLRLFEPERLDTFYPALASDQGADVEQVLELLGVDARRALADSRMPGAPEADQLEAASAARRAAANERGRQRYDPSYRAGEVLRRLATARGGDAVVQGSESALPAPLRALVKAAVARLLQPGGLLGRLDVLGLRDLSAELQEEDADGEPLRIEAEDLLIVDQALALEFPEQYRRASVWQRWMLSSRAAGGIDADRNDPLELAAAKRAVAVCDRLVDAKLSEPASGWRFALRLLAWQVGYWLLGGWLLELGARALALRSRWARALERRFRVLRFGWHLERARLAEDRRHLARAMIELRAAQRLLSALAGRESEQAERARGALAARYRDRAAPFAQELAGHLDLDDDQRQQIGKLIDYLVNQVSHQGYGVASELLLELESSAIEGRRPVRGFDPLGWARALAKRPLVVELPIVPTIKRLMHLRRALQRVERLPLPEALLKPHLTVLRAVVGRVEAELGARLEPEIEAAFAEAGVETVGVRERFAEAKIKVELLELLVARGHSHFSDLRDLIARNQLKLDDFRPVHLWHGDLLSRVDEALARRLPGIHRRGEAYLKLFQLLSSMAFGTLPGRVVVRALLVPGLIAAFLMLLTKWTVWPKLLERDGWPILLLASTFLTALLMNTGWARRGLYHLCWRLPGIAARRLANLLANVPRQALMFGVYPAVGAILVAILVWLNSGWLTHAGLRPPGGFAPYSLPAGFLISLVVINSALGIVLFGVSADVAHIVVDAITRGLLRRLYQLVLRLSTGLVQGLEWVNYSVIDALRLIKGESRPSMVIKAALSLAWFPIYYVSRLYILLFLEPQVNPLKFPIVSVFYKLILPFYGQITTTLTHAFDLLLPHGAAVGCAQVFALFSTGIFGFVAWELKENWRLYRRNASEVFEPIVVGHHGETMAQLLRPGFHSGTVPKLFRRRREALAGEGSLRAAGALRDLAHERDELLHAVSHVVEQDLLRPLLAHPAFAGAAGRCSQVQLSASTIVAQVAIEPGGGAPAQILRLAFLEKQGVLTANLSWDAGQLNELTPRQAGVLAGQLAAFYKQAEVDASQQAIEDQLAAEFPEHSLTETETGLGLLYEVRESKLQLYFVEDGVVVERSAGLSSRLFSLVGGSAEKDQLPLRGIRWFRSHAVRWKDFEALHQGDLALGLTHLPLLGASQAERVRLEAALTNLGATLLPLAEESSEQSLLDGAEPPELMPGEAPDEPDETGSEASVAPASAPAPPPAPPAAAPASADAAAAAPAGDRADPELWRELAVGDRVRVARLPERFARSGYVPSERTLAVYRQLRDERRPLVVSRVDRSGPWVEWWTPPAREEWQTLLVDHDGLERVDDA